MERVEGRLVLLRNSDHLLRRFGKLELIELAEGEKMEVPAVDEADRIYFVSEGEANVALQDERQDSPSAGVRIELFLRAEQPKGLLVPFGVDISIEVPTKTRLIMLSTHNDEEVSAAQTKL
ncbi:MAG: hypothetical protein O3B43_05175 [Chloroflexi bacterium]|nr:hypothetical protein [Chloroflexota bacterium]